MYLSAGDRPMITDKRLEQLSIYVKQGWPDLSGGEGNGAIKLLIREVRSQRRKIKKLKEEHTEFEGLHWHCKK